ncbi:UDP-N-acetylmuramoyl-L-alanyl-D-glutamate--2,6-diaminopimelate ligase [Prochlorococcus sp. MIT 1223]|uniref:UDP-N-acetylmuramoyl-L-alanyl-D-glutamate--2, 6-diaminopimelate ligase n=1 Tax=Prochlorococcus sp. MIT 1223 TaxID=3096217 RepID=UPI002A74B854|nr:UDP-N-acetylmuramoyl-L-alanyl-D-glutamate--2,6-diaminopimelate ligase [Prochlorococcus sp. MIT 1223]
MERSLHSLMHSVGLEVPEGLENPSINSVTCDSRYVNKGALFLGLPGETCDGGLFWQEAFSAGAVAAVISSAASEAKPSNPNETVVVVPDPVSKWIGELISAFCNRPSLQLSLIGVTGTNGKTTTTYLIDYLSSAVGRPSALFGTLVNRWPSYTETSTHTTASAQLLQEKLSLAAGAGAEIAAMEVSSHAIAQCRIAGCHFSGAVFTNLSHDHLDYHGSMNEYFSVKTRLFQKPYLDSDTPNAVVNIDNDYGFSLAQELDKQCWRCSLDQNKYGSDNVELFIDNLRITADGVTGCLNTPVGKGRFISPLIGKFNLMNLLQSVGALVQQGLPLKSMLDAIFAFPGVPGRMERITIEEIDHNPEMPTVIVDYAHTPDALGKVLIELRPFTSRRIICVFGCGGNRDRGKRSQMGRIAAKYADLLIVTSDNPRNEEPMQIIDDILNGIPTYKELIVEVAREQAIQIAVSTASFGDLILIAGKGHEDYQIIGNETRFFDDKIFAQKALREKLSQ